MPRTPNRSPEERLRLGRSVCIGGEVFEVAACVALLFLMPWPENVIVVVIAFTMLTSYNILLWRTLNKAAARERPGGPHDGR